MLGVELSRGLRFFLTLLSALAVGCGALNPGVPQALAADTSVQAAGESGITMDASAVAPYDDKHTDNQYVYKGILNTAVVKVHVTGLEPGKEYTLRSVAYDLHDPEDHYAWDSTDGNMFFTPPDSWQANGNRTTVKKSDGSEETRDFKLNIEWMDTFKAKSTEADRTVEIGKLLTKFENFDETLADLIEAGKFVMVTSLHYYTLNDASKPTNQTYRELHLSPALATFPERDSSHSDIEKTTLTAIQAPEDEKDDESGKSEEDSDQDKNQQDAQGSTDDKQDNSGANAGDGQEDPDANAGNQPAKNVGNKNEENKPAGDTQDKSEVNDRDRSLYDSEQKAKEEAERKAKEDAERKAQEEADRKAKEEADKKAQGAQDAKSGVKSAEVYAKNKDGNSTHAVTPDNASTAVQHLELEKLQPNTQYNVETYMRANGVDGEYFPDSSGKTPMLFSATPVTTDNSGNLNVDVPLSKLGNKDFKVPFAEGQDELKAVVQNKVAPKDGGASQQNTDAQSGNDVFTYPDASTPAAELEKQTLSFSRTDWDAASKDTGAANTETKNTERNQPQSGDDGKAAATSKDQKQTPATSTTAGDGADKAGKTAAQTTAATSGGASTSDLPGKQDTASSSTQGQDESLLKKLSNGTKVMPGGDVAPGSPAQNVGKSQTTVNSDSKKVSLNPPPKDTAVTITSDAGIVGGKLTKGAVVVDKVSFTGLRPDTDYALKGELICAATQKPTGAANSITFRTPKSDKPTVDGSTTISIPVLSDECKEQVVVETLYEAVNVGNGELEAGTMVATTAGRTFTAGATVKDGKTATPAVVTQQVQPAKGVGTQPTSSVRVIKSEKSPSTVTTTGSVREYVGAGLEPQAQRVVVSNVPSGPVGLPAQSAPFIE